MKRRPHPGCSLRLVIIAGIALLAPVDEVNAREPSSCRKEDPAKIEQVGSHIAPNNAVEQVDPSGNRAANIEQVPSDAHVAQDSENPEAQIGISDSTDRKAVLYAEVAEVWQTLRARGQQPTPELIAREIGPENLSSFLTIFPGAETMFGVDSDTLPVPASDDIKGPGHNDPRTIQPEGQ